MAIDNSNRVKELRESRGWTQRELADRADVTDQTISNLERGLRPTLATALAVAGAFGEPVEAVFAPPASTASVEDMSGEIGAPTAAVAPSRPSIADSPAEAVGNSGPVA